MTTTRSSLSLKHKRLGFRSLLLPVILMAAPMKTTTEKKRKRRRRRRRRLRMTRTLPRHDYSRRKARAIVAVSDAVTRRG